MCNTKIIMLNDCTNGVLFAQLDELLGTNKIVEVLNYFHFTIRDVSCPSCVDGVGSGDRQLPKFSLKR